MKRFITTALTALALLSVAACGPGISPDMNAETGYELLFELPAGCTLVSEAFALTTEDTGYTGNTHAEAMLVTAVYVIENEGAAVAMSALQPAPMARLAIAYPWAYYVLTHDEIPVVGTWMFRSGVASWRTTFSAVAAEMGTTADRDPGLPVYRHAFRGPAYGESGIATVAGSGRLVYEGAVDGSATEVTLLPSDDPDEYVFYSLGEEAAFTFDYDAGFVTEPVTFDELCDEIGYDDRFESGFIALALSDLLMTDQKTIRDYELRSGHADSPSIESAFSYELTLGPGTNTIVMIQPIWATCRMGEESCVYRFGFDEERYLSGSVPIEIALVTNRTVSSCTLTMSDGMLVFDATKSLLEIDTLAKNSVGSGGMKPVVEAVPTT